MSSGVGSWIEERIEAGKTLDWFLHRKVPKGVGWWYTMGSATGVAFVLLLITGPVLMLAYSPSPDHAYDSVQYIVNEVPFGWLIRSIHHWSASAMVVLVGLHGLRAFFTAGYKYPREMTWVLGSVIFLLTMVSAFTGYLLPWDQKAYWATNVGIGIAGQVPFVGDWIQRVLTGGTGVGAVTLTRFFTLHVGVVPALILVVAGIHLFLVIRQGISAPMKKR